MVHMIILPYDQFGNRYKFVAGVFERRDQGVERLRRILGAVMTENDTAAAQMFVLGHGFDDGIHAVIFPVKGIHVPLDRVVAELLRVKDQVIVIGTVWRAEEKHFIAGKVFYLIMYLHQFFRLLLAGERRHILVVFAVISEVVSRLINGFYIVRVALHPAAGHKKGNFDIVFLKDFQYFARVVVSPR